MSQITPSLRACRVVSFLAATLLIATPSSGDDLTPSQRNGREIYRHGTFAGAPAGTASIGDDGIALPTSSFACANCHGIWGDGGSEGGIQPPSLSWKRLTLPGVSPLTGRHRIPYSPATLRQAITTGHDPSGAPLHAGMPHFTMPPDRIDDLIAYLHRIGDDGDTDPGVSATSVRIGVAVPLSGPLAPAGQAIRATLQSLFADASHDGGIYGRTIELVAEDSQGTAEGLNQATRRLIDADNIFAAAASLETMESDDSNQMLAAAGIPLIGPITLSPHEQGSPNRYVFYLLPDFYDQARAVVDFVTARQLHPPKLAVLYGATSFDRDVVEGLQSQARLHGLGEVLARPDVPQAVSEILSARPDYLIFAGDGPGLAGIGRELAKSDSAPVLIGFISTAQSGISLLPSAVAARALFAAPAYPPNQTQAGLFSSHDAGAAPPAYFGLRTSAFAGSTLLLQALRTSGKRLNRDALVHTIEGMQHFETGVTPPLSFGPRQRVGSAGCIIMAIDPHSHALTVVGNWITPQS